MHPYMHFMPFLFQFMHGVGGSGINVLVVKQSS